VGALAWAAFAFERVPAPREGILPIKPKQDYLVREPPKFRIGDESTASRFCMAVRYRYAVILNPLRRMNDLRLF
jgi:hypothetical protein